MSHAGLAKLHLGSYEQAVGWCRRAIEANRNYPQPHFVLGAALARLGRLDEAGSLGVQLGTEKFVVPAGGTAAFPAGVVHTWWNAGDDPVELSGHAIPAADLDCYLQAVFAVLNASTTGRPSLFYIAHIALRHRHTQGFMRPPLTIQRIVFPLVVLVGYLLGKYRGGSWPGSPESCSGAPEVGAADLSASPSLSANPSPDQR